MAIPVIKFHYLGSIYSPFSGMPSENEDGPNEQDPSLLFIYYGNSGIFGYISPLIADYITNDDDEKTVEELIAEIEFDGGVVFEIDTDWNGVNYYGFAPFDLNE